MVDHTENNKKFLQNFDFAVDDIKITHDSINIKRKAENQLDSEEVVGPDFRKKPKTQLQELYLDNLPHSELYERSYMHRDIVTHIIVSTKIDYIITVSNDGHVKFWKKVFKLIDFLKHFRAHSGPITGISLSPNHEVLATVSPSDNTLKIFDVLNYDLSNWIKLSFSPYSCEILQNPESTKITYAISEQNENNIHIIDENVEKKNNILHTITFHQSNVEFMKFNNYINTVISIDNSGLIQYWDPVTWDFNKNNKKIKFKMKIDTDLFEMNKISPLAFNFNNKENMMAILGNDKIIRIFSVASGRLLTKIDETIQHNIQILQSDTEEAQILKMDKIDLERRIALEKEIDKSVPHLRQQSIEFDESDKLIIYPTILGIKVVELKTKKCIKQLGKQENSERFLKAVVFQGKALKSSTSISGQHGLKESDPIIFCTAFKKSRFYIFSKREPEEIQNQQAISRDVFNERPSKDDLQNHPIQQQAQLATQAVIQTTMGDIHVKLFKDECPKTVENFMTHAKNDYYNNVIFHRVIKGFMIQSGDPDGDGTGGQSIWGGEFEDEFHPKLKHDRPFTLSMANCGPNTNGSQFFITTVPTQWLDNKHTVFGRVFKGMDVCQDIENVRTDKNDKPLMDIKILTISIIQ